MTTRTRSVIENYINGNLSDSKKAAICVTWENLYITLRSEYGKSEAEAIAIANYLKGKGTFQAACGEWSGSLCPKDPDNFWIDDATGERVNATTGERQ